MWQEGLIAQLRTIEHPAWGPAHWRRLNSLCKEIAAEERLEIDEDVIFACAWLHDIGTFGQFACIADDPPTCASLASEQLLKQAGFPEEKLELVQRIIREHSFEGEFLDTIEARVLRDADMLEFLGTVGLVRLLSIVEVEDWVPEPRAAIALAMQFAEDLPPKLFYESSKRLAAQRIQETHDFVESLGTHTAQLEMV